MRSAIEFVKTDLEYLDLDFDFDLAFICAEDAGRGKEGEGGGIKEFK